MLFGYFTSILYLQIAKALLAGEGEEVSSSDEDEFAFKLDPDSLDLTSRERKLLKEGSREHAMKVAQARTAAMSAKEVNK